MTQNKLKVIAVLAAVALLALGAFAFSQGSTARYGGEAFERLPKWLGGGVRVGGDYSTLVTNVIEGTCNASTSQLPLEATSTDDFACSVPGVLAGDRVEVMLASNSGSVYGGFTIGHTVASADTITFGIVNLTGAATTSFPLATTSVQYRVSR